jgi:hypothetical protein
MAKKIYTEQTEYGQRIVIDYGTHKTVVDVEDGDKSGMGDDRVYIAHECSDGEMIDITRVSIEEDKYITDTYTKEEADVEYNYDGTITYMAKAYFEDFEESEVNE